MDSSKASAQQRTAPSPAKYRFPLQRTPSAFSTSLGSLSRGLPVKPQTQSGMRSCVPSLRDTATLMCKTPSSLTTPCAAFTPAHRSQTPIHPTPAHWNPLKTPLFPSAHAGLPNEVAQHRDNLASAPATGLLSGSLWASGSVTSKAVRFPVHTTKNQPLSRPVPTEVASPHAPPAPCANSTSRPASSRPYQFATKSASLCLLPKATSVPFPDPSPPWQAQPAPHLPTDAFSEGDGASPPAQPPTTQLSQRKIQPTLFFSGNFSPARSRPRCSPLLDQPSFPLPFFRSSSVAVPVSSSAKPSCVPSTTASHAPSAPTSAPHSNATQFTVGTIRRTPVAGSVPPRRSPTPSSAPRPASPQPRMKSRHAGVHAVTALFTNTPERVSRRPPASTRKLVLRQKRTSKVRPQPQRLPLRNPRAAVKAKSVPMTELVSAPGTQLKRKSSSRTLSPASIPDAPPEQISLSDADNTVTVPSVVRSEMSSGRTARRASLPEVFPKAPTKRYYTLRRRALSMPRSNSTLNVQEQQHAAHVAITSWTVTCNKHCHKASHHHSPDHPVSPSTANAESQGLSSMPVDISSSSNIAAAAVRRAVDYLKRPGKRETADIASMTILSLDNSMLASVRSPAQQKLSTGLLPEEDETACSPCRNAAVNRCAQKNAGALCAECTFMVKESANRRMQMRSRGVQTVDTGDRTVTVRGLNGANLPAYASIGDTMLDVRLSLARNKGVHPSRCLLIDDDGAMSPNREASSFPEVAFCVFTSLPFVFVAFAIPTPQVRKYDAESGRFLQAYTGHVRVIRDIALAVEELLLFSVSEDGTCKQFNFESGRLLRTFGVGHSAIPGVLTTCVVSQKAKFLCVASEAIVCRFDVASGHLLQKFTTLASMVLSLALSACERYLYVGTGGTNRSIRRFAIGDNSHTGADNKVNEEIQRASQFGTVSHMVSHIHPSKPDVECLVTASNDGNIRIFRSGNKTGLVCVKFINFGYTVRGLAVHEDSIYVSGSRQAQRYSFDGELKQTFFLPDYAHKIAVSPCGEYLYVAMNNSVVQFSTKSGNSVEDAHQVKTCIEYPEGGSTYALATF